jgi:sugar phosphate isomerase/epimerase
MTTIQGPAIFLAQFMSDVPPFNSLKNICAWAKNLGFVGVQIPSWDSRCINLQQAAESKTYADEIKGIVNEAGLVITELSAHLQGQLIAVHPAYNILLDGFAPTAVHGNAAAKTAWATQQLKYAAKASYHLGLKAVGTFSGSLLWPMLYPWPQRPEQLVNTGFEQLAHRWLPLLHYFDQQGVDLCYEIHPGEDLHDGITYELFLDKVHQHPRACLLYDPSHFVLQCLDYLSYIDHYHQRIKMFHVKDAEFNPTGKQGVYGGYQSWVNRAGRFRSLGDGQVQFKQIFSKLATYSYTGWAVMEWECAIKDAQQGAKEGAIFIQNHIIPVAEKAFDDFAASPGNEKMNKHILGLE